MSGGLLFAVECVAESDLRIAADGARFLGLDEIAGLLSVASSELAVGDLERMGNKYHAAIPSDATLVDAFARTFRRARGDFAPVSE